MPKNTKFNHKPFLSTLEQKRGKPIGASDIVYVSVPRGNGVAMIIDGVMYDVEAVSVKEVEE